MSLEDTAGQLADLVGSPLTMAEEAGSDEPPPEGRGSESYTWTYYRFATAKGYVTVRFFGESNGYYSESVNLVVTTADGK